MKNLSLHIPTTSYCGPESAAHIGRAARRIGTHFLLVTENQLIGTSALDAVKRSCENQGVETIVHSEIGPFPSSKAISEAVELAAVSKVDGIIGFGDIYSLSIAKASAAIGRSSRPSALIFSEEIDDKVAPYPYFEIPSTVRSPFLFSRGLYLIDARNGEIAHPLLPTLKAHSAMLDPALLDSYSQKYSLSVVMDLLLSAIEGYFSTESTFFSDTLLLRAIGLILSNLQKLIDNSQEEGISTRLQQAGFFAAYGLSMSTEGVGTATSHILAVQRRVPQPVIATILLPYVLEYGVKACPDKVSRMGPMLGENLKGLSVVAAADRVVESIRTYLGIEQLPTRLSELGIDRNDIQEASTKASSWPLLRSLPKTLGEEEIASFLRDAM